MDTMEHNDDGGVDRQVLFEGAVLAILARVVESGMRADLAASEYLARFPIGSDELHILADMIICVSDGLRLMHTAAGPGGDIHLVLNDATRVWRDTPARRRLSVSGGATRIQVCIGNIRRALIALP